MHGPKAAKTFTMGSVHRSWSTAFAKRGRGGNQGYQRDTPAVTSEPGGGIRLIPLAEITGVCVRQGVSLRPQGCHRETGTLD